MQKKNQPMNKATNEQFHASRMVEYHNNEFYKPLNIKNLN